MAESIVYNEELIKEINKRLNQMGEKTGDCTKKMASNYSGYTSHGMLNETVKDLDKNFNSLESVVSSTANSFLKHGSEMIDFDRSTASEIEGMNVPQDFVGNNSIEINYYNASILSKIDGKSISKDKSTEEETYDDSTVIAAEDLFDMNKNEKTDEKKYDDTTIIGKSILGSVNGGQTDQKEIDESTSIGNVNLKNVEGGQTTQQNINTSTSINGINLGGVSDGDTKEQDYDDSTVIGESILGSINSEKKDTSQVNVDEAIAALDNDADIEAEKDE